MIATFDAPPPRGTTTTRSWNFTWKFAVDIQRQVEEALDVSVVQRLDAEDVGPGFETADDETAVLAQREAADQLAGAGVERDRRARRVRRGPLSVTVPLMLPRSLPEFGVRIGCRRSRRYRRPERSPLDRPGREGDREHHRLGAKHAAAAGAELGFAERGMTETEEMADLVKRDRLDVEAIRLARLRDRPEKSTEFRKMSDSRISPVTVSKRKSSRRARGPGRAGRRIRSSSCRRQHWRRRGETGELRRDVAGRHAVQDANARATACSSCGADTPPPARFVTK